MTQMTIDQAGRDGSVGYKVDASRGQRNGRVSSEWFSRPDDQRFLSLADLYASVRSRSERSRTRTVESSAIRVEASRDNPERLTLALPGAEAQVAPTLELRSTGGAGRGARRLFAPASGPVGGDQSAIRPVHPPDQADQDPGD